jgi:transposase
MTVSIEKRQLVVNQHKKGKSTKEIAGNVEVELRTVERILKLYRETGDITPTTSTGRHRLLSPRDERELYLQMRREPNLKPSTLRHSLAKKVSPQTITRSLNRAGLHPYKMRRKPRLTPAQRHARLE